MVFPSSRPLKKGRSGLGVAGAVEGEPRLEQVGGGLHPLAVDRSQKASAASWS
jgi:hypothetical protein